MARPRSRCRWCDLRAELKNYPLLFFMELQKSSSVHSMNNNSRVPAGNGWPWTVVNGECRNKWGGASPTGDDPIQLTRRQIISDSATASFSYINCIIHWPDTSLPTEGWPAPISQLRSFALVSQDRLINRHCLAFCKHHHWVHPYPDVAPQKNPVPSFSVFVPSRNIHLVRYHVRIFFLDQPTKLLLSRV